MTLAIKDVDAQLGAEVAGIDVSQPLTASDVKAIVSAWSDRRPHLPRSEADRPRAYSIQQELW
jgi:hypothetical protein